MKRGGIAKVGAAVFTLSASVALAQGYPNRPVRVLSAAAGGGIDVMCRVITQYLSTSLGQQFVVDNRGGGGGIIAGEIAAKAPPDGYTLLCYGPPIWMSSLLRSNVPFSPLKDFAPITMATITPNVLVVHPAVPVQSVSELIALAKARPGQLNDAGSDLGSSAHPAMELFKAMADVNVVRIPYKGVGPGVRSARRPSNSERSSNQKRPSGARSSRSAASTRTDGSLLPSVRSGSLFVLRARAKNSANHESRTTNHDLGPRPPNRPGPRPPPARYWSAKVFCSGASVA